MKQHLWIVLFGFVVLLCAMAYGAHRFWTGGNYSARDSALATLPSDASAVLYADITQFREAPFTAQLYAWAPRPQQIDAEYAQFLHDTGFDYESDLDRVAIAMIKRGKATEFFAVVDGRFDRKKINVYTSQYGTHASLGGREVFTVPVSGSQRKISFLFLHQHRIALTDDADLTALLALSMKGADQKDWRARFDRLAGTPVFAVIRPDAAAGDALAARAPGGFQSEQLAGLLDQLQWITIAGKPEGDDLRVVLEGECPTEGTARQLSDFLNGALILAQAGLNGLRVRQQLDPQAREAYLEVLKGADISRIDRGETKSVRVVFEVTPRFLAATSSAVPATQAQSPPKK